MHKLLLSSLVVSALSAAPLLAANAQQSPAGPTSGVVVMSEPGKAMVARTIDLSAKIVAIEASTRTVSLKGPKGNVVDIVCGDEVKNFDQLKLNDMVHARYQESLYLELKKTKGDIREGTERSATAHAAPGETPAGMVAHQVVILADVVGVDPKKSTISLKGPKGNVLTLPVMNPDQFKVVKVGDQVEATYTQALALVVEPVAAAKGK